MWILHVRQSYRMPYSQLQPINFGPSIFLSLLLLHPFIFLACLFHGMILVPASELDWKFMLRHSLNVSNTLYPSELYKAYNNSFLHQLFPFEIHFVISPKVLLERSKHFLIFFSQRQITLKHPFVSETKFCMHMSQRV